MTTHGETRSTITTASWLPRLRDLGRQEANDNEAAFQGTSRTGASNYA
jgi:hypothetical protein